MTSTQQLKSAAGIACHALAESVWKWGMTLLVVFFVACLASCGGGGGGAVGSLGANGGSADGGANGASATDSGGVSVAGGDGGIGGTGVSSGGISGFGSIWVNGVEFNTDASSVTLDGVNILPAEIKTKLHVGMVVTVQGSIANKIANTVRVDQSIKGQVESANADGTLTVMGQTVWLDAGTVYSSNTSAGALVAGDIVDVHGLIVADGQFAATYVEKRAVAATPPFAVKGLAKNHNTAAKTFQIGGLTVNYGSAITSDMPAGLWNGLQAQAVGSACAGAPVCGTLTASKVEPNGPKLTAQTEVEMEGFATSVGVNTFTLGTQTVNFDNATVFEHGTLADLVAGVKVEVEGSATAGTLFAKKISFRDNVQLEADVASVGANQLVLSNLGLTVKTNALTKFSGKGGITSLAGILAGHHVEVRGSAGVGNTVVAKEVKLIDTKTKPDIILRGPSGAVTGASPNQVASALGVAVDTTGLVDNTPNLPTSAFRDKADQPISRSAFFAGLKTPNPFKAKGKVKNGAIEWSELSLED